MTDRSSSSPQPSSTIPPDDPRRKLSHARPDEEAGQQHLSVAGDTYTILLTGRDTAGRFTLIDMHVPPGGGPPPHRHDFEETFSVLEGKLDVTFRGTNSVVSTGETVNVPANAPHSFRNASDRPARILCTCSHRDRRSSLRRSETPSQAGRHRRPSSTRPPSPRGGPEPRSSHRNIAQNCSRPSPRGGHDDEPRRRRRPSAVAGLARVDDDRT